MAHRYIWLGLMLFGVALALWRGGRPERIYAVMLVLGSFATRFSENHANMADAQVGIFVVDVVFLAGVTSLAMLTDRWWLLFASAFQVVEVVTHAAMMLDHSLRGLAYFRGLAIWSYLSLASLLVGLWLYDRDRRRQASAG